MPSSINKNYDVVVLGGGAAGLMSAFTAGRRGRRVLVLEKSNKVGKKILMSGGGRCNFTNELVDSDNFLSDNLHFCKSALSRFTSQDFVDLVELHDIEYEVRKRNQYFCTGSSKNILDMLLLECESAGVNILTDIDVRSVVTSLEPCYRFAVKGLSSPDGSDRFFEINCDSLIIATGALSIPTLGGSGYGYALAEQFDLPVTEKYAGLVPFMFSEPLKSVFSRLSGISTMVEVEANATVFMDSLLFTHRGLSGPSMLQISNYWSPGDELNLNLMPDVDLAQELLELKKHSDKKVIRSYLVEYLPRSVVSEFQALWFPDLANVPIKQIASKDLDGIGNMLNAWIVKPSGTEGYRTAEVTVGGVSTNNISSQTMEVKDCPGLYFVGEVLDVTGHLGGFNFQWAWASGYVAGLVA